MYAVRSVNRFVSIAAATVVSRLTKDKQPFVRTLPFPRQRGKARMGATQQPPYTRATTRPTLARCARTGTEAGATDRYARRLQRLPRLGFSPRHDDAARQAPHARSLSPVAGTVLLDDPRRPRHGRAGDRHPDRSVRRRHSVPGAQQAQHDAQSEERRRPRDLHAPGRATPTCCSKASAPASPQRLGIDYATLCAHNPRLIYCAISGYGQDGPYRDCVGHDVNYLGYAGVLNFIGTPDGRRSSPACRSPTSAPAR